MSDKKFENSPPKSIWTKPVITVIEVLSARGGAPSTFSDSATNHRS